MPNLPKRHQSPHFIKAKALRDKQAAKTTSERYGYDWVKATKFFRIENPLCLLCEAEGFITLASEVDHIIPIVKAPERRLDPTNWQHICKSHHSIKSSKENPKGKLK
jgi:5-methylcytosine-specific restriction enzyme A